MGDAALKTEFVSSDQLKALLGVHRDADVKRWLDKQGIPCFEGRNGVWTTQPLIELAGRVKLGLVKPEGKESLL